MKQLVQAFCALQSPRTAKAYQRDLALFEEHCASMGGDLADAQRHHVISFEENLSRRGNGPATRRRRMSAIRSFYSYLDQIGVDHASPATGLDPVPTLRAGGFAIGIGELLRCLAEAARDPDENRGAVLALVLLAGYRLRVDQMLELTEADLDRERATWRLGIGDNSVVVPRELRSLIPDAARHADRFLLSGAGTSVTRQTVGRWIRRLGEDAELSRALTPRILQRSAPGLALTIGSVPSVAMSRDWTRLPDADHPAVPLARYLAAALAPWRS